MPLRRTVAGQGCKLAVFHATGHRLFRFDNTFARDLAGAYVAWEPATVPAPRLLQLNVALADELGLDPQVLSSDKGLAWLSGNEVPAGASPLAQAYAGHQFGGFSPQLGDGRALLLGELIDVHGRRRDIALKGSGRTPFSRQGDGKAALGPALREYLIGEAMHALGIATTRALAVVSSGEEVRRERLLPGAVLTRVAASHIRIGTFQYLAARGELELLRRMADHVIARHDPALAGSPNPYLGLLAGVAERQAALVASWMNIGFIHGVMNTDNMSVSGETLDYGPCAFVEVYDPQTVFSSIDHRGRYAFGNQPLIARWNLARLAEAMLPLLAQDAESAVAQATEVVDAFAARYETHWRRLQRAKLGLLDARSGDDALADDWLSLLQVQQVDFTLAWRRLADAAEGHDAALCALFERQDAPLAWLQRWRSRCAIESIDAGMRASAMRRASPYLIPRNHQVEQVLDSAVEAGDLAPFRRLLAALNHPFDEDADTAVFGEPAPREMTAAYRTFCGT